MRIPSWSLWCCAFCLLSCKGNDSPQPDRPASASAPKAPPSTAKPRIIEVTDASQSVAALVRNQRAQSLSEKRDLVVYVGASWCEPCQRFHHAVLEGQLDATFPTLDLMEFDLDRDQDRLVADGYASKLVPLFAIPAEDGRSSGKSMEGSIKGPGAVGQITPRLRALIQTSR